MSETPQAESPCYLIDDLMVDTGSRQVTRAGEPLRLVGLTFDFLLALIECAPAMASYEQIAERVWHGRSVTPETIAQRAKMLRDALSDDARSPHYFELIRGQGYRLVADVALVGVQPSEFVARRWRLGGALVALAAVLAISATVLFAPDSPRPSVAVLPLADLSATGDQQYLADGIAEELINQLAGLDGLEVASRTESFFYRQSIGDLRAVGDGLGVSAILEGSVRKSDDDLRITVQLIDVDSGFHLWSGNFDRRLEDIFAVQEDIAVSVAGALGIKLGVGGVNEFPGAGTRDFEAYQAFLQGDYEKAIRLDPNYAAAWARRGLYLASTMHENLPEEAPAIIKSSYEHVAKAIDLDPESAVAHANFATLIYVTMDWDQAEQSFARSMSLRRDHVVIGHYANMLMRTGRSLESRRLHQEREAMLRVPVMNYMLRANVDIALRDFDAARDMAAALRGYSRGLLDFFIALNDGTESDVRAAMAALPVNSPDYKYLFAPLLQVIDSPDAAFALLQELANDRTRVWPHKYHNIALVAAYLGFPDLAFNVLHRELRHTTIRYGALWYPVMADARKLPAFRQFLRDVNLVDYWREYGWSDFCRPLGDADFVCD